MAQASVTWVQDFQFVGTDSSKHSVVLSSSDEANGTGMKPSELLLVALGSCTAYDVVNILNKKRQKLTGLKVLVTAEQNQEPPWAFNKFHLRYEVAGHQLDPRVVEQTVHLSEEKYCSVSATLKQAAAVTYEIVIIETGP